MKLFVAVSCLAMAISCVKSFTLTQQNLVNLFAIECIATTGITPDAINKLRDGDVSSNDRTSRCFMKCFFEKESFMDKDGVLLGENIAKALEEDYDQVTIEELLKTCAVQKEDACDTAFNAYECYQTNFKDL